MSSKCVRRCASQLRNREMVLVFFPGSRPGGRHTSQVGTIPLLFRNVLPRQVFQGQIPDCCGPTISKPGQFLRLPTLFQSATAVLQSPVKGGRKNSRCGPSPPPPLLPPPSFPFFPGRLGSSAALRRFWAELGAPAAPGTLIFGEPLHFPVVKTLPPPRPSAPPSLHHL